MLFLMFCSNYSQTKNYGVPQLVLLIPFLALSVSLQCRSHKHMESILRKAELYDHIPLGFQVADMEKKAVQVFYYLRSPEEEIDGWIYEEKRHPIMSWNASSKGIRVLMRKRHSS